MNDKDKEAFEKWWDEIRLRGQSTFGIVAITWKAACEYKKEEYSNIMDAMTQTSQYNSKLQAENAKLRECLKFTTSAAEYLFKPDEKLAEGLFPTSYFTLSYEGDLEIIEKTKRARQVLKELNEE